LPLSCLKESVVPLTAILRFTMCLSMLGASSVAVAADWGRMLEDQVKQRANRAAQEAVDKGLDAAEDAVRCVVTDQACIDRARQSGQDVVLTNKKGKPLPPEQQLGSGSGGAGSPDDSERARQEAIARLRAAGARNVCSDASLHTRTWGTACGSREFSAPPLLSAPSIRWEVEFGWWGTWSPWVGEGLLLTGSCNNDDNKGLSAIDIQSGKVRWRLPAVCDEGQLRGTMGSASFLEAGPGKVLFALDRGYGTGTDWRLIDLETGRILERPQPVKRGPTSEIGGAYAVTTASKENQRSYLNALSPSLDRIVWRNEGFRIPCDPLDSHCLPTFSISVAFDGTLFISGVSIDQPEPPTRELHAFDVATGALKWKHTAQPVREVDGQGRRHRSDDGRPMVVDGKVIIRVEDENSYALRALDPASGRVLWTTDALARRVMEKRGLLGARTLSSWIGAGPVVVGLVVNTEKTELMGWRTSDGRLLWVREVPSVTSLTASAGGVFYTALGRPERKEISPSGELVIEGFEAATGTKLWSTGISSHNRPFEGEWSITQISYGAPGGPGWRIGPDGAIYGVTLKGAYRLY
jgi:outer membrane protein assembly factor BamB